MLEQKSFAELERKHRSLVCRSTRHTDREQSAISISKLMWEYLHMMNAQPMQYTDARKRDNNSNYNLKRLLKYGLAHKETHRNVMVDNKPIYVRPISIYHITDKGKKMLEVLETPND